MSLQEATAAYEAGDLYWPITLLNELEDARQGRGFDWVVSCAVMFLERADGEDRRSLLQWVQDVAAAKESRNLAGLREKSLEIWHLQRDQRHTAVSHLYAALLDFLEGNYREYRKTIFYAISALSRDPAFSQAGLSIPEEVFVKMRTGTSPMP
ncbi:hypothetical protein [Tuwongella immobilis]|uniref:Uncharacterized protein n=1 Tax=Tuwongella immobilis TaxID=692036 RepID=A0A6C2YIF3_9BACT|nr:hypothetical protein [Tuwongella immobilis]VIP00772.1 unnamed protein product [Tuwongella immobilis]VTR96962.1 unnamed protein product [Tuwongella immobilis]